MRLAGTAVRLTRLLDQRVRQSRVADGINLAELGILGQIDRGLDLPSVLARELHLDPPRVTRMNDHLVSLGYVRREADPLDRRLCRLQLTEAGRKRLTEGRSELTDIMSALLGGLSPEERAGLEIGLQGVRRVLDPG
ncbi:MAG: MarR family transcriptional regulator [Chloroflexota bacterium]